MKRRKKRRSQRRKQAIAAESHFTRKDGIIYIFDFIWNDFVQHAVDCHFSGVSAPAFQYAPGRLPARIRIMNDLLQSRLSALSQIVRVSSDQIAPYWVFVYNEGAIRDSLRKEEALFEETKKHFPDHPAVLRTKPCLPPQFADGSQPPPFKITEVAPSDINSVERRRVLMDGLRAVVQLLDNDLAELVETFRRIRHGPRPGLQIPFSHLWYLFVPGCEVISTDPHLQGYRCLQLIGGRENLVPVHPVARGRVATRITDVYINCVSLDFDGKDIGAKHSSIIVRPYEGLMAVTDLPVYPAAFADPQVIRTLEVRGSKFEDLTIKARHRRYKGLSLVEEPVFDTLEEIDSDVVIDFQFAYRSAEPKIPLPAFGPPFISGNGRQPPARPGQGPRPQPQIHQPASADGQNATSTTRRVPPAQYVPEAADNLGMSVDNSTFLLRRWQQFANNSPLLHAQTPGTLTRDGHVLLPTRVYGYSLLNRKWFPLHIDSVYEVPKVQPGENDGFQKLVLPDGHKDIVRALVNSYARQITPTGNIRTEFDVVKGKGKGLIILLHGAPGVGKTSTAECVAANAGRPLLPITCGDLGGITAKEVEQNLETFFVLARKWGCVLLLDEADVFLGARDRGDIRQISLVSVFLRVLEYYSGILILTTNRVGSFDEAIKSRVHCALYYPPLDRRQSMEIWKMNLDTLQERNSYEGPDTVMRVRFNRKEIERFADEHWDACTESMRWNGRQIKNAFQTAVALADWDHFQNTGGNPHPDGPLLKKSHFQTVSQASAHFDDYLMKVRGADQERAKMHEIRRDDIRVHRHGRDTGRKSRGSKSTKGKSKKRTKPPPPPESSSEESEEEDEEEEEEEEEEDEESSAAASAGEEGEEEEEEEEEAPRPPPKKQTKKLVTRKKKKATE
ncbi:hypothetical protein QBC44DRAFT_348938 [Cladorrhinum sp. PSN332]|nr:hypothetical protein QBC44DRAFT_348938 [Cladorrhinum sp. PSN332]